MMNCIRGIVSGAIERGCCTALSKQGISLVLPQQHGRSPSYPISAAPVLARYCAFSPQPFSRHRSMVSTRSGRTLKVGDIANEVDSKMTRKVSDTIREEEAPDASPFYDTAPSMDKDPSGTFSSADVASIRPIKMASPRSTRVTPKQRRISDVNERVESPPSSDVQPKSPATIRKEVIKKLDAIAKIPLDDFDAVADDAETEDEPTPSDSTPLVPKGEVLEGTVNKNKSKSKSRGKKASSGTAWLSFMILTALFLSAGTGSWMVLCGGAGGQFLPSDSPIVEAAAPTCARMSTEARDATGQLANVWTVVVDAGKETAVYYQARINKLVRMLQGSATLGTRDLMINELVHVLQGSITPPAAPQILIKTGINELVHMVQGSVASPAAAPAQETENYFDEEYPLTFRTWFNEKTFKELLPASWAPQLAQFYQGTKEHANSATIHASVFKNKPAVNPLYETMNGAKERATTNNKASSVVLTCQHFAQCSAATAAIRASVSKNVPGCFLELNLGDYLKEGGELALEEELGHQLGGCPNSVLVVQEAERATPTVVTVLNRLTFPEGHVEMTEEHTVTSSGAIVMLMYETTTPAPATEGEEVQLYIEEIKNQVQGDLEAYIGDFDSAVLAFNFRTQVDFVAPLK
eukprot:gene24148-9734_t